VEAKEAAGGLRIESLKKERKEFLGTNGGKKNHPLTKKLRKNGR